MNNNPHKPTGKLYTSNLAGIKQLKNQEVELWLITRAGLEIPNTILVRSLSPSKVLFRTFISEWKDTPPSSWWRKYEKLFLEEMISDEKVEGLRMVYRKLLEGKNIVLICFCNDHRYCHRRLVGEFFRTYGVIAEELNPIKSEQLSMF
jgi:uncharacterized protein YeaO (DUF488 family)